MKRRLMNVFIFSSVLLISSCVSTGNVASLLPGKNIHSLAAKGDNDSIQKMLNEKGKQIINSRDSKGNTPLMMAAYKGKIATMTFLLENGADIGLVNKDGEHIFHAAALGKNPSVFKAFSKKYSKLAAKADYNQATAYMKAAHSGFSPLFFVNLPDRVIFAKDSNGMDIFEWAVMGANTEVALFYMEKTGKHFDMKRIRRIWIDSAQNPNTLNTLSLAYCKYAKEHRHFKPESGDRIKFGKSCSIDW